ncbi:amidase [Salsuginibacillus kocurii]|uniref:amidase n=1 Tax=Salsuginibacillus kocurii TaxID=427078 RepID=UPI000362EA41|nr:amidase [Salsuginibacillus kocurii]
MTKQHNAFFTTAIQVPAQQKGILSDLHFSVKDVFAVEGHTNSAGNPDWLRTGTVAEATAPSIQQLLLAGATLTGMTHTDEIMYSLNGQNAHYGTPINPAAEDRIPGGSSSGAAVSVASGEVDFSIGTDTGGSVRVPSSYCGIYGFRPTHGTVPIEGVIPLAKSFDTVGWMTRDPQLLEEVGRTLLPQLSNSPAASFKRLLKVEEAWEMVSSAYKEQAFAVIDQLSEQFEQTTEAVLSNNGLEEWFNTFRTIQSTEIWKQHGEWIERDQPVFGEAIAARFNMAKQTFEKNISEEAYEKMASISQYVRALLAEDGLLVIPTTVGPAPYRDIQGEKDEERRALTMQVTCIAGLSGLPQVTIPLGKMEGAPVGLSFIAGANKDLELLKWVSEWALLERKAGQEASPL